MQTPDTSGVQSLESLYREWGALTLEEFEAIQAETWDELARLHRGKAELKARILELDPEGSPLPGPLRSWVGELVELERRNLSVLQERMADLRRAVGGLDASTRRLQRVKGAYRAPAGPSSCVFGTA